MNDSTYDLSAGIKFSRTLGNRSSQAKDRAARVTLKQAREALENMRQIIQRDVRIALNDLDRVRQQIAATRVTRMHQEESVKAEQERFEAGTNRLLASDLWDFVTVDGSGAEAPGTQIPTLSMGVYLIPGCRKFPIKISS